MSWPLYLPCPDPNTMPPSGAEKCRAFEVKLEQVATACAVEPDRATQICKDAAGSVAHLLAAALGVPEYDPPKWRIMWQPLMAQNSSFSFEWMHLPGNKIGVTLSYK